MGRVSKNLVEFRRRNGEIKSDPFSGATCACQKTLLGLQTWELCATGAQFLRCSRPQSPLSEKACFFDRLTPSSVWDDKGRVFCYAEQVRKGVRPLERHLTEGLLLTFQAELEREERSHVPAVPEKERAEGEKTSSKRKAGYDCRHSRLG